jgi:hypothetical protein
VAINAKDDPMQSVMLHSLNYHLKTERLWDNHVPGQPTRVMGMDGREHVLMPDAESIYQVLLPHVESAKKRRY